MRFQIGQPLRTASFGRNDFITSGTNFGTPSVSTFRNTRRSGVTEDTTNINEGRDVVIGSTKGDSKFSDVPSGSSIHYNRHILR